MKKRLFAFLLALLAVSVLAVPEAMASELPPMGDVDNNGKVDYSDALLALRASIQLETLEPDSAERADVDNSGSVDYNDALLILRHSIGLEDFFPAELCTVTFEAEGIPSVQVMWGEQVTAPEAPVREGFTFEGWYRDPECTQPFDFGAYITDSVTLYPLWVEYKEPVPEEPEPKVVDLTEKLDALMHESAKTLKSVLARQGRYRACIFYYHMVKDGGPWDIKLQDEWKFEEGTTYIYQGRVMRMDDPGNIHFGYLGAIILPEEIVCLGAGLNNISKFGFTAGDFKSYYDDPQDQEMMRWGYRLYKSGY